MHAYASGRKGYHDSKSTYDFIHGLRMVFRKTRRISKRLRFFINTLIRFIVGQILKEEKIETSFMVHCQEVEDGIADTITIDQDAVNDFSLHNAH